MNHANEKCNNCRRYTELQSGELFFPTFGDIYITYPRLKPKVNLAPTDFENSIKLSNVFMSKHLYLPAGK